MWRSLGVVVALMAAGCVGPSGGSSSEDGSQTSVVPASGPDQGLVEITIADSELLPVVNAQVQLRAGDSQQTPPRTALTDEGGLALFVDVAPGQYTVYTVHPAYKPVAPGSIVVEPGARVQVSLVLEVLPVLEAHHETIPLAGTKTLNAYVFGPGVRQGTGLTSGGSRFYEILENETGDIQTHVLEVTYTPTSLVCRGEIYSVLHGPTYNSGKGIGLDTWFTDVGNRSTHSYLEVPRAPGHPNSIDDPGRIKANGNEPLVTTGRWLALTYDSSRGTLGTPVDYSCFQDQKFMHYWSIFYIDPAPSGWSAVEDS